MSSAAGHPILDLAPLLDPPQESLEQLRLQAGYVFNERLEAGLMLTMPFEDNQAFGAVGTNNTSVGANGVAGMFPGQDFTGG